MIQNTKIASSYSDHRTQYIELIDRLYHIERAFIVRRHIKLHYAKCLPDKVRQQYVEVRKKYDEFFSASEESLIWFLTIETWSRFTSNSKKSLRKLLYSINDESLKKDYSSLKEKNKEIIGFLDIQRNQYFAHADDVSWDNFPNIFDQEYETLLKDLAELLSKIGNLLTSNRIPTISKIPEEHTCLVFDDLLHHLNPKVDVHSLSENYNKAVDKFLQK